MTTLQEYHALIDKVGLSNAWDQILTTVFPNEFFASNRLGGLYEDGLAYEDKIEKCKIVTLDELDAAGNTLAVNTYIEKKKQEVVPPEVVRQQYYDALEDVKKAEAKMKALLIKGGYLDEQ